MADTCCAVATRAAKLQDIATVRQRLSFYGKQLAKSAEPDTFTCDRCGKVLASSRGLKLHMARKHRKR